MLRALLVIAGALMMLAGVMVLFLPYLTPVNEAVNLWGYLYALCLILGGGGITLIFK